MFAMQVMKALSGAVEPPTCYDIVARSTSIREETHRQVFDLIDVVTLFASLNQPRLLR